MKRSNKNILSHDRGSGEFWPVLDGSGKPGRAGSTRAINIFFSFPLSCSWKLFFPSDDIYRWMKRYVLRFDDFVLLSAPDTLPFSRRKKGRRGFGSEAFRNLPRQRSVQVTRSQLISGYKSHTDNANNTKTFPCLLSFSLILSTFVYLSFSLFLDIGHFVPECHRNFGGD